MTKDQLYRAKKSKGIVAALYRANWYKNFDRLYDGLQTKPAMLQCMQGALANFFKIPIEVDWDECKDIFD